MALYSLSPLTYWHAKLVRNLIVNGDYDKGLIVAAINPTVSLGMSYLCLQQWL
jgi:hypothetical protein